MLDKDISGQVTVRTERLTLRMPQQSDAGLLGLYTSDERVARGTRTIPHPLPPGATEAYIARANALARDEDVWVMDGSADGLSEVLGIVSLTRMDRGQSEIAYWVAPAFWNTGLASEAVTGLIAANPHQSRTLFASVFQDNAVSARVLTNAGFEYIGDAEAYSVARGAKAPTWTYIKKLD